MELSAECSKIPEKQITQKLTVLPALETGPSRIVQLRVFGYK
jgi:hypothetical protein